MFDKEAAMVCLTHCHMQNRKVVNNYKCNNTWLTIFFSENLDEEVKQDGVTVFIDKKAQLTLLGTEMDYVENKLTSEFVFNNPNIKGTCGCGESFSIWKEECNK